MMNNSSRQEKGSSTRPPEDKDGLRVDPIYEALLEKHSPESPAIISEIMDGLIVERRQYEVAAPAEAVYRQFIALGGDTGWLYANWLWHLRGILDRFVGGVGFRKGRRHPTKLRVGDVLDFYTTVRVDPGRLLRLRADFKVPGEAWLQFEALPGEASKSQFVLTAFFIPEGRPGMLYWDLLHFVHGVVFSGLSKRLVRAAEASLSPR